MPASEARIAANRKNAQLSTGPKTEAGKEASRANAVKHGMTGTGVAIPKGDLAEVDRRAAVYARELNARGEVGAALARMMALNSMRVERGAHQQATALAEHIRRVEADFAPPEGVDAAEADRLRRELVQRSMFDPSKEAALARSYGLAAERTFLRCLKELQRMERAARAEARAAVDELGGKLLGSFSPPTPEVEMDDAEFDALYAELDIPLPPRPTNSPHPASLRGRVDLPIAVGRRS